MGKVHSLFMAVVVGVVGCSGASADDGSQDDTSDTQDKLLAGRRIPEEEVALILRGAGFPEDVVPSMVCTAKYESDFYERASNRNKNGSIDRGLLQVNSEHLGAASCPKTAEGLYDAKTNAKCAHVIWAEQGITAWYGYKKHKRECDAYVVGGG